MDASPDSKMEMEMVPDYKMKIVPDSEEVAADSVDLLLSVEGLDSVNPLQSIEALDSVILLPLEIKHAVGIIGAVVFWLVEIKHVIRVGAVIFLCRKVEITSR